MSADVQDYLEVELESADFSCEGVRIRRLSGREAISSLFSFDLEIVSTDPGALDGNALAGSNVTIVFLRRGFEIRRVHGMIAEVDDLLASLTDLRAFRVRVVPRLHRTNLIETLDIFMTTGQSGITSLGVTVPEIIQAKLKLVDLDKDAELRLVGEYPKREFVVQYKETDLAFLSRLCEHVGISFFVEHKDGRDVLVFTDHQGGFPVLESPEPIYYRARGEARDVFHLEAKHRLIPKVYVERDYNYRHPLVDLTSDPHTVKVGFGGGVVEYGAHFDTKEEGTRLAKIRAEERLATQLVFTGKSDLPALAAGSKITIEGHPFYERLDLLLTEVEHKVSQVVAASGDEGEHSYVNTFHAVPADRAYRPPRVTPKPRIHGLLTGIIDPGPQGTERIAQIDDQGRYTVRFLFDTSAPGERPASHPVRMAQNHAGENYGTHFPLKPGVEVVLAFVDGDPDSPIIVGAVPNPTTPSPITNRLSTTHRIKTGAGITIDFIDE